MAVLPAPLAQFIGLSASLILTLGPQPQLPVLNPSASQLPISTASSQQKSSDYQRSSPSVPYPLGMNREGSLWSCPKTTDCVSSSGREAPNRYMSALTFQPSDRKAAFTRALSLLKSQEGVVVEEVDEVRGYLHAVVNPPVSKVVEDIELLILADSPGVVTFRDTARTKLPTPPFCVKKNCINGNQLQRARMETLAESLGWAQIDRGRMEDDARWTPIFFNTDAVPPEE